MATARRRSRQELVRRLAQELPQEGGLRALEPAGRASEQSFSAKAKELVEGVMLSIGGPSSLGFGAIGEPKSETPTSSGAAPPSSVEAVAALPEVRAYFAALAATDVKRAEGYLNERAEEVDALIVPGAAGKESDAVLVARINASVERERIAAEHVQVLRKIESDEKIAALRGAVDQLVAAMRAVTDRAVAAEARVAELQRQREANAGQVRQQGLANANALAVAGKQGFSTIVVAVVGLLGVIGGALIGACARTAASNGVPPTTATTSSVAVSRNNATNTDASSPSSAPSGSTTVAPPKHP